MEAPDGARDRLGATVVALRRPASYPGPVRGVEAIETHMSWVFLTETRAYKLKKPIRTAVLDHTTTERRRRACETEIELNRRLAPDVYLAVVPVARAGSGLRVGGKGPPLDWLIEMRRLPRGHMLDARIEGGDVEAAEVERLAATLIDFYARTERAPESGPAYRRRIAADIEVKSASLAEPHYGLDPEPIHALLASQRRWLERHGDVLEARGAAVLDAHGDLRPEHICLEPEPVVIDCLEFDRSLRLLDPVSELSFLALECRRLGAAWIGETLLASYGARTGDRAPETLVRFYHSRHAVVRAAVAVWHLDDHVIDHVERWRERAGRYLGIAGQMLGADPQRGGRASDSSAAPR